MELLYNSHMIFDGRAFAKTIENQLRLRLLTSKIKPKIVSILVGNDPASELYIKLKGEAAERVGIEFEAVRVERAEEISKEIENRGEATGIMIQLPILGLRGETLKEVLTAIPLEKDIDGLRWRESGVMPATVAAVISILQELKVNNIWDKRFVVWGARGAVGEPLVHLLRGRGAKVAEIEIETENPGEISRSGEVVISCVGKPGVVTAEMVRPGSIVVDVGISQVEGKVLGDMVQEVYDQAVVTVPVPGGVGPVTVSSLLQNTVELYANRELD